MKVIPLVMSILFVCYAAGEETDASKDHSCYALVDDFCGPRDRDINSFCSGKSSGENHALTELNKFANNQLTVSYHYLLFASYFDLHSKERPGFEKLFRSLSDKAFENTIKLIKQITKRGGQYDMTPHQKHLELTNKTVIEVGELKALSQALDLEMKLFDSAREIHRHDAEISHFIEEEFLKDQAETIRKLAGYTNNLKNIISDGTATTPLGVYMFDQYLQKV